MTVLEFTELTKLTVREFADRTGVSYDTVKIQLKRNYCKWPRIIRDTVNKPSQHPLYQTWTDIIKRTNPNSPYAKNYYDRGITIYPAWNKKTNGNFENFRDYILETIGPRPKGHSIDRIDNDKGYIPGNLRWATQSQQVLNSRNVLGKQDCGIYKDCNIWVVKIRRGTTLYHHRVHSKKEALKIRDNILIQLGEK